MARVMVVPMAVLVAVIGAVLAMVPAKVAACVPIAVPVMVRALIAVPVSIGVPIAAPVLTLRHRRLRASCASQTRARSDPGSHFHASGGGLVSTSARNVSSVEGSAMPSTRAGRKWRWNAVMTSRVASSKWPLSSTP
jgi:hypothetical protein